MASSGDKRAASSRFSQCGGARGCLSPRVSVQVARPDGRCRIEDFGRILPAVLAMTDRERGFARTFPNQTEVTVKGLHFAQEDSPDEIGDAIAEFVDGLYATRRTRLRLAGQTLSLVRQRRPGRGTVEP